MLTTSNVSISKESLLYMKILAARCGIDLSEYKQESLQNRIKKRLHILKLKNFEEYCQRLREDIEEEAKFINLITNVTTSFFRENHHFEFLQNSYLPELFIKKNKIRIWSAGCSTGEEVYSLSIIIHELFPHVENLDIKILATDINSDSLQLAEEGVYEISRLKNISHARQMAWFESINPDYVKINKQLKSIISFARLNLMDVWPMHGPFDIILCRNVIIYFKSETSQKILKKFHHLLAKDGILILGSSENLYSMRDYFVPLGKTIFKKVR